MPLNYSFGLCNVILKCWSFHPHDPLDLPLMRVYNYIMYVASTFLPQIKGKSQCINYRIRSAGSGVLMKYTHT